MIDKSSANSVESTHGSSGAAKYLINQLHLRPVETTRGIEAPKILQTNSNNSNLSSHHHHHHFQGQAQQNNSFSGSTTASTNQRLSGMISDKLRPLLEGSRFGGSSVDRSQHTSTSAAAQIQK